jgi:4,5-dihydroxyphthalate decarboxylase
MAKDLELSLLLADYHRTRPLLSGEVTARGLKLNPRRAETGEACLRPVYEEFDIAEMSLSWYMMARCRKEPVIALPIFPLRMQIHPYIFCSSSSAVREPEDLKGKLIGMDQYRLTVGLWARGILQEYYGIKPADCMWVTAEPGTGRREDHHLQRLDGGAFAARRDRCLDSAEYSRLIQAARPAHPPGF